MSPSNTNPPGATAAARRVTETIGESGEAWPYMQCMAKES